jgi:hypothetical protein
MKSTDPPNLATCNKNLNYTLLLLKINWEAEPNKEVETTQMLQYDTYQLSGTFLCPTMEK